MQRFPIAIILLLLIQACAPVQSPEAESPPSTPLRVDLADSLQPYLAHPADRFALIHARLIDGTLPGMAEDQTLLIEGGRCRAIGATGTVDIPAGYTVIDARDKTVIRRVELVVKNGIAYDPERLLAATAGRLGER